jgi:flagellar assembly protein FliH
MVDRRPESGVIRAEKVNAQQWNPPQVGGKSGHAGAMGQGLLTAAQLDAMREAAQQEGFEQGRKEGQEFGRREGIEQGREQLQARIEQFDGMLKTLDKPFDELDQQVEDEVVTLVINMVRQLIRREVKLDPGQIVGVVREALGVLPISSRNIRVVLHPEDAVLVREAYTLGERDQQWQIVEDPVIQRGGCRINTDTSQIDATLDSRLSSLIAPLLSGERLRDAEDSEKADG